MNGQHLQLITTITMYAYFAYINAGMILKIQRSVWPGSQRPRFLNTIWRWTKWPALLAPFSIYYENHVIVGRASWDDPIWITFCLLVWWYHRDSGDDDPFDDLKDAVTGRVQRFANRLIVVPA